MSINIKLLKIIKGPNRPSGYLKVCFWRLDLKIQREYPLYN